MFDPATRTFRWTPGEAQGPGLFEGITFSVSDGEDTDSETISIAVTEINAAPAAQLAGPASGVRGQPLAFTGAFTDADVPDTHEVAVDWGDGTGTAFNPSTDPGALTPAHVYTATGTYEVTWSVRDEAGALATASQMVTIAAAALQPDPVEPGRTALFVGGTTGNDVIKFSKDRSGGVKVVMNKVTLGVFAPTGRVVAFGQAGNDDISVGATVLLPVEFHGGEGNDKLKAGKMGGILVGGPGNDKLTGGAGRDLLIGGEGADALSGSGGDDILIAGRTAYDDQPDALRAIMAEWTRTDAAYADRVERLRTGGDGGGRNGTVLLNAETVLDDGVKDALTGGPGLDWFFAGVLDKVTGRQATEILTAERPPSALAIAWGPVAAGLERGPFRSEEWGAPTVPEFTIEIGADAAEDVKEDPLLTLV
jgi:Ca2+-binding RTX toxin-like protein